MEPRASGDSLGLWLGGGVLVGVLVTGDAVGVPGFNGDQLGPAEGPSVGGVGVGALVIGGVVGVPSFTGDLVAYLVVGPEDGRRDGSPTGC